MKKFNSLALAAILSTTGAAAFADQATVPSDSVGPVAMTDTQMDNVAAGLLNVVVADVVDVNNVANNNQVQVAVPVNAAAAVAILGQAAAVATQPGNITQRR